ncbi:hypothetical protein [Desulfovibrio gilichinskyi]|uniref:Uncharacterized protein n=1 Tax=Desulfovibrio gilichinskyi TaxID=1519643 RepID=A0A1X7DJL3_9BACT|nr:hypothetical protein [Desulfovibrio gilichinskyi]SMF16732.1 hypothetical protein SAMN06295933_1987 [Desulfovibrio gilichinskyi]
MQIQSTGYAQAVNTQYSSSAKQEKSVSTTSSSSGDKISISPEAKEKAQKMNSEKTQEEMGRDLIEACAIPDWAVGYLAPSMIINPTLDGSITKSEEIFRTQHRSQTSEYSGMMFEAYTDLREKYNIEKSSDFAKYSATDMENDFRTLLAENPRSKELMEILDVPKKL